MTERATELVTDGGVMAKSGEMIAPAKPYFAIDGHTLGDGTVVYREYRDPIFPPLPLGDGSTLHYSIVTLCPGCELDEEDCECGGD